LWLPTSISTDSVGLGWRIGLWRVLLLLLLAWGPLHFALVRGADLNPWKLGGMAMYVTRIAPSYVQALDWAVEGTPEVILTDEEYEQLGFWLWNASYLGKLARPDALARQILEVRPTLHELGMHFETHVLRGDTSRMQRVEHWFVYRRQSGGAITIDEIVHHLVIDEMTLPGTPVRDARTLGREPNMP
jgi:hypothetical protein